MDAARCSGKKPWWSSADPAMRMEIKYGADPTCSICSPQLAGAMYPHFIRQQRTSLDVLRNRKHVGQPKPLPALPSHRDPGSSLVAAVRPTSAHGPNVKSQCCCSLSILGGKGPPLGSCIHFPTGHSSRAGTRPYHSSSLLSNHVQTETPGPGAYDVDRGYRACLPSSPSITIQGVRRPKRHETGPFTTF
ncbi:protein STPG3 isoform X3 [Gallus gallus]|uniref:protein STPG3 isoform X3 n=1 Tax=Gallus gallus TaxID=9031 RepID=UPI001AE1EF38|nr:protein STPG3 isoform X3 [Gallus gallus]